MCCLESYKTWFPRFPILQPCLNKFGSYARDNALNYILGLTHGLYLGSSWPHLVLFLVYELLYLVKFCELHMLKFDFWQRQDPQLFGLFCDHSQFNCIGLNSFYFRSSGYLHRIFSAVVFRKCSTPQYVEEGWRLLYSTFKILLGLCRQQR